VLYRSDYGEGSYVSIPPNGADNDTPFVITRLVPSVSEGTRRSNLIAQKPYAYHTSCNLLSVSVTISNRGTDRDLLPDEASA